MTLLDVRRDAGRLAAVRVDGPEGQAWIEGWGLPRDEQDLLTEGAVVTVSAPAHAGLREPASCGRRPDTWSGVYRSGLPPCASEIAVD